MYHELICIVLCILHDVIGVSWTYRASCGYVAFAPTNRAGSWTLVGGLIAEEDPVTVMGLTTHVIVVDRLHINI